MKRILFTFGTLYPDDIISALLGAVPPNFYATLTGYSIYKGSFEHLPSKVADFFLTRNIDKDTFSYLFAKQDTEHGFVIDGRAYEISLDQELILDHWERYPDWYRKQSVNIKSEDGSMHEAFIYTLDIDGERLIEYKRVMNELEKVLANAKATRQRVKDKFPILFK
jgi:gamma-glutamylcyclotransferase (GGCT)/AIG2-like uncharacterized protein YtfP